MDFKQFNYNHVSFFAPERKKYRLILLAVILTVIIVAVVSGIVKDNYSVKVKEVPITHEQIPEEFEGYRILHISDINGEYFGDYQKRIKRAVENIKTPFDIVILTGDYLSNPEDEDFGPVLDIIDMFDDNTQVYYVLGERDYAYETNDVNETFISFNPEEKNKLMQEMEAHDAVFVYPIQEILRGESKIYLTGTRFYDSAFAKTNFDMDRDFSICVTHVPITYDVNKKLQDNNTIKLQYVDFDFNVAGHTLGGVIRLPILGALYSPLDGFFPQEDITYGLHTDSNGRIRNITSGLGVTKAMPFRVNNIPEVCVYTLHCFDNQEK